MRCLVCGGKTETLQDPQFPIIYHVCEDCEFIFKDVRNRVTIEEEAQEYDRHNNNMESTGYVNMFKNMIDEFVTPLNVKGKVLDYGSGPGPVLYQLLTNDGFNTSHFDPVYNKDLEFKNHIYQLITCTEVVEHFFDPMKEFKLLASLLEKDGYLLLMTQMRKMNHEEFLKWWYRRDKTHVSFYNEKTFEYIASQHGLEILTHNNKNIILFQKK